MSLKKSRMSSLRDKLEAKDLSNEQLKKEIKKVRKSTRKSAKKSRSKPKKIKRGKK